MSDQYMGQIEIFSFPYAPKNWAICAGQTMSIAQFQALFSLLGTMYGGDGVNTFMLPNLQGRAPIGFAQDGSFLQGQAGGEEQHTLNVSEIPQHNHLVRVDAATVDTGVAPTNTALLGQSSGTGKTTFQYAMYSSGSPAAALDPRTIGISGGAPHPNMMPYLAINFCICLYGIYPSRS